MIMFQVLTTMPQWSTTPTKVGNGLAKKRKGLKRKPTKKENNGDLNQMDNLSWFDLDPVFGFPPED